MPPFALHMQIKQKLGLHQFELNPNLTHSIIFNEITEFGAGIMGSDFLYIYPLS